MPLWTERGVITLDVEYIDGAKIGSKANKYTFVWRKTIEKTERNSRRKYGVTAGDIAARIGQAIKAIAF